MTPESHLGSFLAAAANAQAGLSPTERKSFNHNIEPLRNGPQTVEHTCTVYRVARMLWASDFPLGPPVASHELWDFGSSRLDWASDTK